MATFNSNYDWKLVQNGGRGLNQRRSNQQNRRMEQRQSNLFTNSFSMLSKTMQADQSSSSASQPQQGLPLQTFKPPPVVVDMEHNIRDVQTLLSSTNIRFRQMQTGTKVFTSSKDEYNQVLSSLKNGNFKFYTHRSKDDRQFKVFLYGLPKLSTAEILADLKTKNLEPTDLKEVLTKVSNDNNAAYSMLFKKSNLTLRDLKKVQYLCRTKVTWRQYNSKDQKNPTICWKCLMYGHGGDNCFRAQACMICASTEHIRANCPYDKEDTNFKCFNCVRNKKPSNHRANDKNCPSRADFLNIRQNIQNRNNRHGNLRTITPTTFASAVNNPMFNEQPSTNNTRPQSAASYADVVMNGDLYSIDELFKIFQTSLTKLRQCTTKDQQIAVVASLLQYAI